MKNTFRFTIATLAATVTLAGCVQEITSPSFEKDKVNPAAEGSRVIAVSFGQQTKTTLEGFQPKFANKDSILISNGEALDTCAVDVNGDNATITTNLTGPLTAVYPYTAAGMSEDNENEIDTVLVSTIQSGKFADANICMAKMTSENDESLSFENKTAVFCIYPPAGKDAQHVKVSAEGFVIANNIPTGSAITDSSTIHVNTTTADSVYVSILVPEGLKVSHLTFSDGTNVKAIPAGATADKEIAVNTLYTVTNENWKSPEADTPEGAIKGVFSVSATKKVHFSKGNLQAAYDSSTSTYTWGFAANQYDYIGDAAGNTTIDSQTNGAVVDLFGWSTASTTYGINTSTENSSYSGNFVDWGKAYCESKSITPDNTWRTLSTAEWQYLFNSRSTTTNTGTTNARYAKATVNSKTGIILLPDAYTHPSGVAVLTNINTNNAAFTVNTYDVTAWEAMESAGAVFLPAAGYRNGFDVDFVGGGGDYWSSTARDELYAYYVGFDSYSVAPDGNDTRYCGFSVRLVTDVSAAPTPTEPASAYVEIEADYDNNPSTAYTTLKWYRQNLAITTSGNKSWKGGNESAVKVPGTNGEEVIVGDYFQWAASYGGYNVTENQEPDSLLIYTSFTNTGCGESEDKFTFIGSKLFNQANAPYSFGSSYDNTYSDSGKQTLDTTSGDDVAHIILGENWRMPTSAEFKAMKKATYWAWDGTAKGYYVFKPGQGTKGKANERGNISASSDTASLALLFFPAAGRGNATNLNSAGDSGIYWSSSLYADYPSLALRLEFNSSYIDLQEGFSRYTGYSVRPVSE